MRPKYSCNRSRVRITKQVRVTKGKIAPTGVIGAETKNPDQIKKARKKPKKWHAGILTHQRDVATITAAFPMFALGVEAKDTSPTTDHCAMIEKKCSQNAGF